MPPSPGFRALSLDLWFTVVSHGRSAPDGWEQERARVARRFLVRAGQDPLAESEVAVALQTELEESRKRGAGTTTDPGKLLYAAAGRLGAEVTAPEAAAQALSDAGLEEHPPDVNLEVVPLLAFLAEQGVPVALVTNSARRATSWEGFFGRRGIRFDQVVSSCDLGRAKPDPEIFREAARRLSVPPERMLHVGDRWELDVAGGVAAGCGVRLYEGLWPRYADGRYTLPAPPAELASVPRLARLDALIDPALWDGRPSRP